MTDRTIVYQCVECGAAADVLEGELIRTCEHDGAVAANVSAAVHATSSFALD